MIRMLNILYYKQHYVYDEKGSNYNLKILKAIKLILPLHFRNLQDYCRSVLE